MEMDYKFTYRFYRNMPFQLKFTSKEAGAEI
jgi:hypothetical protein